MKKIVKYLSGFLAAAAITACAVPTVLQSNDRNETGIVAESLGSDSPEVVAESLSNYLPGHMSWGVKRMGLDQLQKKLESSGKKLPEVKVAVLDTGIKKSNRYLQGRYTEDGYNFISDNTDFDDDQYHGTEVSGVIADGTSSNVKILPIKVMDKNGDGKMANTAKGIYYALDHGADVINLSLSGDDKNHTFHSLDDAIAEAISRNAVVVVAAGNQDTDASLRYPANKNNVITITSVNKANTLGLLANYGSVVDFALPGMNVLVPHKSIMLLDSGTSLAAPHAAAAAALLKTWCKDLNQEQIVEIFKQYAVDLGEPGFDNVYGWGMLDLSSFDINAAPPEKPVGPEPALTGDVNLDGTVDINDATMLQRYLAELLTLTDEQLLAADVNRDGNVNVNDVTQIQRILCE